MFTSIMEFLGSAFGVVTSMLDFISKKDIENQIRKGYEEEKRADNLEEDKVVDKVIDNVKEKVDATKEDVKAVRDSDIRDAELSKEDVKAELAEIEDEEDRRVREKQIIAAAELKKRKSIAIEKINKNDDFNNGGEITFQG